MPPFDTDEAIYDNDDLRKLTKAKMIEEMAETLAVAGLLTLDRIIWLAGLRSLKKKELRDAYLLFLLGVEKGILNNDQ